MADKGLAREYAGSLMAVAGREKMRRFLGEARFFSEVLEAVPDLHKLFSNPSVETDAKERMIDVVAVKAGFDRDLAGFIKLVVSRKRVGMWREIVESISELADESEGVVRGKVMSATPLSQEQKRSLEACIAGELLRRVELEPVVEPDLIGGCEVRIGSQVYDGTLRRALEDIRNSLLKR